MVPQVEVVTEAAVVVMQKELLRYLQVTLSQLQLAKVVQQIQPEVTRLQVIYQQLEVVLVVKMYLEVGVVMEVQEVEVEVLLTEVEELVDNHLLKQVEVAVVVVVLDFLHLEMLPADTKEEMAVVFMEVQVQQLSLVQVHQLEYLISIVKVVVGVVVI